ncbi:unnamed protein product, partial [Allacma fusca]
MENEQPGKRRRKQDLQVRPDLCYDESLDIDDEVPSTSLQVTLKNSVSVKRKHDNAKRVSTLRANETTEVRERRILDDARRHRESRSKIDPKGKSELLQRRAAQHAQARLDETHEQRRLLDHMENRANSEGIKAGKAVILPSSFMGSPRNMQQLYQDAMAMVRKYGKPDLFLTMTTNPRWREIVDNLLPCQTVSDRPDLVARVFNMKARQLLKEIKKDNILGIVVAYVYTIEYQKRSLPHMHMLIILHEDYKPKTRETIDKYVSAEIPDKENNPKLYDIILKHMIHGPCGNLNTKSPCMENGKCVKEFPKRFSEETVENHNGYPVYRRRQGSTAIIS